MGSEAAALVPWLFLVRRITQARNARPPATATCTQRTRCVIRP